jgi:hypothetical protein
VNQHNKQLPNSFAERGVNMKKVGGMIQITTMVLSALLLCGFTVPGTSGTMRGPKPAVNNHTYGSARFEMTSASRRSHLLDPVKLVEVVGDSSDGGYVQPPWCYEAYQRCLASCDRVSLSWDIFGLLGGQWSRSISLTWTYGCSTGCAIGLASCG